MPMVDAASLSELYVICHRNKLTLDEEGSGKFRKIWSHKKSICNLSPPHRFRYSFARSFAHALATLECPFLDPRIGDKKQPHLENDCQESVERCASKLREASRHNAKCPDHIEARDSWARDSSVELC
jgi:hypothetical protein